MSLCCCYSWPMPSRLCLYWRSKWWTTNTSELYNAIATTGAIQCYLALVKTVSYRIRESVMVTVFTQWLMCNSLSVIQECFLPRAAEDHPQLWHIYRDARSRSHTPPLPPRLGCHLWTVRGIFCPDVCMPENLADELKEQWVWQHVLSQVPLMRLVFDCEILPN